MTASLEPSERYQYAVRMLEQGDFKAQQKFSLLEEGIIHATVLALMYHGVPQKNLVTVAEHNDGRVTFTLDPRGLMEHGAVHRAFPGRSAPDWLVLDCRKQGIILEQYEKSTCAGLPVAA